MEPTPDARKAYDVSIGGVRHRLLLTVQDAARYGEAAVEVKQADPPANKARRPRANKAQTAGATPATVPDPPAATDAP